MEASNYILTMFTWPVEYPTTTPGFDDYKIDLQAAIDYFSTDSPEYGYDQSDYDLMTISLGELYASIFG